MNTANAAPEIVMAEADEQRPTWKPIRAANCAQQGAWWTHVVGSVRSALADPRSLDGLSSSLQPGDKLAITGFASDQTKARNERAEFGEVFILASRKPAGQREGYRAGRVGYEPIFYRHFVDHARGDFDD